MFYPIGSALVGAEKSEGYGVSNSSTHPALRLWAALIRGFAIGLAALFLSSLIDLVTTDQSLAELVPYLGEYLIAGIALAACSLQPLRQALTQQTGNVALAKRSLFAVTIAVTLFFAITMLVDPQFPVRWLFYFYVFSVLFDWLVLRFLVRTEFSPPELGSRSAWLAAYLDEMPHAPFVAAGLFLLALTPFYLFANLQSAAERLGNWAFGFLVLGVSVALIDLFVPKRIKEFNRYVPTAGITLLLIAIFTMGYLSESAHTKAEVAFLVDTQPSYLAPHVTDKDIVVSDSPSLRLNNIPNMATHLDLLPDQRGLALWSDLTRALQGKRTAYWVDVSDDSHDTQGILASYLKTNGCLEEISSTILPVRAYSLRLPLTSPRVLPPTIAAQVPDAFNAAQVDFGAIQMTGFSFEPKVCSHDAVSVALRWRLVRQTEMPLKVSLFLNDAKGRRVQSQDFVIQNLQKQTTDQLSDARQVYGYHLLVVPFGTPPGQYTLSVGVYPASTSQRLHVNTASGVPASTADSVTLGQIQVYRSEDYNADPYKSVQDSNMVQAKVELADGLRLVAYGLNAQSVLPGESLSLTARWRALLGSLPSYQVRVQLAQNDRVIAEATGTPVDGTYPTNLWSENEIVVDHWDLHVPPDTTGGKAQLKIGAGGGKMLDIADVNITAITHTFQVPSMRYPANATFVGIGDLIGYDLDSTRTTANEPFAVTLYWRAGKAEIAKNYTVFAQLLAADGHLIAQSDSAPAGGRRPTRGWVSGEIIADRHELTFTDQSYQGEASLIVGVYDPATFVRLPIQANSLNYFKLPLLVQVTSP